MSILLEQSHHFVRRFSYFAIAPQDNTIHQVYSKAPTRHAAHLAAPKDEPSAGITIATAIISACTQRLFKKRLAMSGEITLRGVVLPVGGIKEKVLAAQRAGIKTVILSKKNEKDVLEIEKKYIEGLKFQYVNNVDEIFELALESKRVKNAQQWHLKKNKHKS